MNLGRSVLDKLRHVGLGRSLRPVYPPVALEVGPQEVVLVRLKRKRGQAILDATETRALSQTVSGLAVPRALAAEQRDEVQARMREAFEASGTRPGKVSLVLPDNLAKVTLVQLPELPASKKRLSEMVRFKLRKAVPFKLEDAAISYQLLPSPGPEAVVLVAVMLRSIVEQFERSLETIGARPGMVGLCTPNLFNLCRASLQNGGDPEGDTALLNCTPTYFSLLIVRDERLIFYRCKSTVAAEDGAGADASMGRELAASFSYYQEKLSGRGIRSVRVRTTFRPFEEIQALLQRLSVERVEALDLSSLLAMPEGKGLDPALADRIAPAAGAAAGGR